jgi:hypothetical protein
VNKIRLYKLTVCLLAAFNIKGQEFNDDAALWLNVYLDKKISKHFNIHLNQQNRINYNFSNYGMGYADIGLTYNLNKNIKFLADYVYAKKLRLDGSYNNRHQAYIAIILRKKWGQWSLTYRNMIQSQVEDPYSSYDGKTIQYYERNKMTLKYELNKYLTPYIAQELYLPFDQSRNKGLDRSRSFAGVFYNLTKRSQLEFYFLYQHRLNAFKETNRDFIYGIGYSYQF